MTHPTPEALRKLVAEARSLSLSRLPLDFQACLAKCADALEPLLDASERAGAGVPTGWRLVPVEPSAEQIKAIEFAVYRYSDCSARDAERGAPYAYRAGLAAAPQPPGAPEGGAICPFCHANIPSGPEAYRAHCLSHHGDGSGRF